VEAELERCQWAVAIRDARVQMLGSGWSKIHWHNCLTFLHSPCIFPLCHLRSTKKLIVQQWWTRCCYAESIS